MLVMERELRNKGKNQIPGGDNPPQGQGGSPAADQRGVLPSGVTPPMTASVSFKSDEEKAHAEKAVKRGIYSSLAEYCQLRDGKSAGFVEQDSKPKFG